MTNNKQQTAVDILFSRFLELFLFHEGIPEELQEAYNIAKEVEKERLSETWIAALEYGITNLKGFNNLTSEKAFEKFYNETYGGNK